MTYARSRLWVDRRVLPSAPPEPNIFAVAPADRVLLLVGLSNFPRETAYAYIG